MFNTFFVRCPLLSEKEGGFGVPFSSLGTATEVSPTHAAPGQALHAGEKHRAQCSPGKSTWRECGLGQSVLNQKHLKGCPPLWFCGRRKHNSLGNPFWAVLKDPFEASCSLFLPGSWLRGACWCWLPPKTLIAFCSLEAGVPPILSDQDVTQVSLQTYGCAEERAAQVCREKDHLPACLHPQFLQLWSPAGRTEDRDLC